MCGLTLRPPRWIVQRDSQTSGNGLRILVADDNRDAADTLGCLLRLWGYEVRVAYGGHEALKIAEHFLPSFLLLDIGMPRIDGFSVAREVRRQPALAGAVIIAITAYSDLDTRQRASEAGFNLLLVKPVDPNELRRTLAQLLPPT